MKLRFCSVSSGFWITCYYPRIEQTKRGGKETPFEDLKITDPLAVPTIQSTDQKKQKTKKQVLLDRERERADRLERAKHEEDEALSDELRDIMATVGRGADGIGSNGDAKSPSPSASHQPPLPSTQTTGSSNGRGWVTTVIAGEPKTNWVGAVAAEGNGHSISPRDEKSPRAPAAEAVKTAISSDEDIGREIIGEGLLPLSGSIGGRGDDGGRRRSVGGSVSPRGSGGIDDGGDEVEPSTLAAGSDRVLELYGRVGDETRQQQQQYQGALKARVVELELQRREAVDALKAKMDQSLRLEVQVKSQVFSCISPKYQKRNSCCCFFFVCPLGFSFKWLGYLTGEEIDSWVR